MPSVLCSPRGVYIHEASESLYNPIPPSLLPESNRREGKDREIESVESEIRGDNLLVARPTGLLDHPREKDWGRSLYEQGLSRRTHSPEITKFPFQLLERLELIIPV